MKNFYEGILLSVFKLVFSLIAFSMLFMGCSRYYTSHNIYTEDGLIYKEGEEEPFTGRILDTLDNKIIEYDVVNGLKNGEFVVTSINNKSAVYGFIKDNKNVGKWSYFYRNGNLESEGNFTNDKPHGKWIWYYESGKVKTIGYYINGAEVGTWKTFDEKGSVINLVTYFEGEIVNEVESAKFISL